MWKPADLHYRVSRFEGAAPSILGRFLLEGIGYYVGEFSCG